MHYLQLYFGNDEIDSLRNLKKIRGKNSSPKSHPRSETVQRFSTTPFARDSLVLHTLHDLLRSKEALSSLKYHIFT